MKHARLALSVAAALLSIGSLPWAGAAETDTRFDIRAFRVEGNSLLPVDEIERLVATFTGPGRNYGDIQKTLEALEGAYRAHGYGTVQVYVPEQELDQGVVRLTVSESVIGTVTVSGNTLFTTENVRASLPQLREGQAPNMRQLSENVQLANENPAKQVEVTLAVGAKDNEVNAKVAIEETDPLKFILSFDNTGTATTGNHRLGLAVQHANVFGSDEVLTFAYTGSPDVWLGHPDDAKVDIYSVAFRKPFYSLGDSIDVIYGKSNVNSPLPQAQQTGANVIGKGESTSLRYNHLFPRQGEFSSRLVGGFDYKYTQTTVDMGSGPVDTAYTVRPVSLTYSGQWVSPKFVADFNVGVTQSVPMGARLTRPDGVGSDRYSSFANRNVSDRFAAFRYGGSYMQGLGKWQMRAALVGQYTDGGLPDGEQLGLVGSNAVRGFAERVTAADRGYVMNLELYTPELSEEIGLPGSLRALVFADTARGQNLDLYAPATKPDIEGVGSWGVGLRYSLGKTASVKLDVAQVLNGDHAANEGKGDWRGHLSMSYGF